MFVFRNILFAGLIYLSISDRVFAYTPEVNIGGTIGLSATFGTKVNRIGLVIGGFIAVEHLQINSSFNRFYCYNSYGPDLPRKESQFNLGVTGSFGPEVATTEDYIFFSPVSNFTGKKHSVSYVYKIYKDNISTSQNSGVIGFQTGNIQFYSENDLFIFKGSDKYRTGAISLNYQYQNTQVGISCLLWTADNTDKKKIKVPPGESAYNSKHGYYDLSQTKHGRYSQGILALHAAYDLPYSQTISVDAGIDAEQVRHVLQNKILHDMPFVPDKWIKAINPHFPMLDTEGNPFLDKENQKIRKPLFFGATSLNPTLFY